MDSQAADAVWEEWWAGDLTDYAVGWAWWNVTAGLVSFNDKHEDVRGGDG